MEEQDKVNLSFEDFIYRKIKGEFKGLSYMGISGQIEDYEIDENGIRVIKKFKLESASLTPTNNEKGNQ